MSKSPFLPQGTKLRNATRRRTRRRAMVGFTFALALVGAAGAGFIFFNRQSTARGHSEGASARTAIRAVTASSRAALAPTTDRSRLGLPLGRRPLALAPAQPADTVRVSFHHPPRAGLLFDLHSGRVLWQLHPQRVLPIASLAKMMTALLVVRSRPPDARVLITRHAVETGGSKLGVLPRGKHVGLEALLYGLLLPSGNDAAVALAEAVSGSVGRFVEQMNREAARLGLGCTRYESPDGLSARDSSCAADLAELASVDLDQPRIAHVVRNASAVVPFPIKGGRLYLYNNNPLLRYGFPGTTGMKTGETEEAGLCLVGTAERGGVRLGVVLLHSPELGRQAAYLLSRGFVDVYHQRPRREPRIPPGR